MANNMGQHANYTIDIASPDDVDGILDLQKRNQISEGGTLSASVPGSRILEMMSAMPLVVARKRTDIVGFLMTSEAALNADIPIVRAMLDVYPGTDDAYIYGPVCVDGAARGKRLAQLMFDKLRTVAPDREGLLFIRQDNAPSLNAHRRMGMQEVGVFMFNAHEYTIFSFVG